MKGNIGLFRQLWKVARLHAALLADSPNGIASEGFFSRFELNLIVVRAHFDFLFGRSKHHLVTANIYHVYRYLVSVQLLYMFENEGSSGRWQLNLRLSRASNSRIFVEATVTEDFSTAEWTFSVDVFPMSAKWVMPDAMMPFWRWTIARLGWRLLSGTLSLFAASVESFIQTPVSWCQGRAKRLCSIFRRKQRH